MSNHDALADKLFGELAAMMKERDRLIDLNAELVAALNLVLEQVGGCHDCWELSASYEHKKQVEDVLKKAESL